jgi:hypothetical protein
MIGHAALPLYLDYDQGPTPPTPGVDVDKGPAIQAWLDLHADGETATLPEGTYMVQHRLELNADINFINGAVEHTGTCTAASATTITQTGAGWSTNQHAGRYVIMTSGSQDERARKIVSNTATVLTVLAFDTSVDAAPTAGDTFIIHSRATLQRFPDYSGAMESATATSVTDTGAAWTVDEHVDKYVLITSGAIRGRMKLITDNTATTLTVESMGATVPLAGDTFVIVPNDGTPIGSSDLRNNAFLELRDRDGCEVAHLDFVGYMGFFFTTIFEGQHAFNLAGAHNVLIRYCGADGYAGDALSCNAGDVNDFTQYVVSHDCAFADNGRQGITLAAVQDLDVHHCSWDFVGRSWVDMEPPHGDSWPVESADADTLTIELTVASATVSSATTTTLTDSSAAWTTNQWQNRNVLITSGAQAGQYKVIDSNTATTLTLKNALGGVPAPGDTFDIQLSRLGSGGGQWIKVTAPTIEDGFSRQVASTDNVATFTWVNPDPNPPAPGATVFMTRGGAARCSFTYCQVTDFQFSLLGAGNHNGIFCDDLTIEHIVIVGGGVKVNVGNPLRRPKRLTVKNCTSDGSQSAEPHMVSVDGIIWHDNDADYQNDDTAGIDFDDCTDVDYITADVDSIQMDLHLPDWGVQMVVRSGTYTPNLLADDWDNFIVPDQNCGVYVAAGNELYAEPGLTATIADTNVGIEPTVIAEAGCYIGGHGLFTVRTELFGDVIIGDEPPPLTAGPGVFVLSGVTPSVTPSTITLTAGPAAIVLAGVTPNVGVERFPLDWAQIEPGTDTALLNTSLTFADADPGLEVTFIGPPSGRVLVMANALWTGSAALARGLANLRDTTTGDIPLTIRSMISGNNAMRSTYRAWVDVTPGIEYTWRLGIAGDGTHGAGIRVGPDNHALLLVVDRDTDIQRVWLAYRELPVQDNVAVGGSIMSPPGSTTSWQRAQLETSLFVDFPDDWEVPASGAFLYDVYGTFVSASSAAVYQWIGLWDIDAAAYLAGSGMVEATQFGSGRHHPHLMKIVSGQTPGASPALSLAHKVGAGGSNNQVMKFDQDQNEGPGVMKILAVE